jgi:hypothetical protein
MHYFLMSLFSISMVKMQWEKGTVGENEHTVMSRFKGTVPQDGVLIT